MTAECMSLSEVADKAMRVGFAARAHLQAAHQRKGNQPGTAEGGKRSAYLDDVGTDKARMKRPDDSSLSWRSR